MKRQKNGWHYKLWRCASTAWAILTAIFGIANGVDVGKKTTANCSPTDSLQEKFLMLVSTLDGRISALDVNNGGQLQWMVQADVRPLLSSSISKLEVSYEGMPVRLIPSLDGELYTYDGESIQAIPYNAESLLSSSHILTDNVMMTGGKDTALYGINVHSGKVRYICKSSGCNYIGSEVTEDEDIIVVKRSTRTVRAVDCRMGSEKWNFSVGQHELTLSKGEKPRSEADREEPDEDGININTCNGSDTDDDHNGESTEEFNGFLKIITPEGLVVALGADDTDTVLWQHKFSSPVSDTWMLHKGILKSVNLFDQEHIPALSSFTSDDDMTVPRSLLYVGMHKNQLYVQRSSHLNQVLLDSKNQGAASNGNGIISIPQIAWRPYLSSAPSRTPILGGNTRNDDSDLIEQQGSDTKANEGALTLWHENYPFDNGFYLYPDFNPHIPKLLPAIEDKNNETDSNSMIPAFMLNWWKVTSFTLFVMVVIQMVVFRYMRKRYKRRILNAEGKLSELSDSNKNSNPSYDAIKVNTSQDDTSQENFTSRYYTEFEHKACLGKGGFGVVFQAKNKMDECDYAVKRICLINNEEAKQKVMREVRALAKLDHIGIVRYYHSWLEAPPKGWHEERDKDVMSSNITTSPQSETSQNDDISSLHKNSLSQNKSDKLDFNPLKPFGGDSFGLSPTLDMRRGGSEEFSLNSESADQDESGSFSLGIPPSTHQSLYSVLEDSKSEISAEEGQQQNIPFSGPEKDFIESKNLVNNKESENHNSGSSFEICFEDSGCEEKSSRDISVSNESAATTETDNNGWSSSPVSASASVSKSPKHATAISHGKVSKNNVKDSSNNSLKNSSIPKMFLFIQMQLCQQETLKDWLSDNSNRDRAVVLDIFDQIVSAVEYVHDCGLMHRDLKPSNIFFSVDGVVKVGDFGLVTAMTEQQPSDNDVQTSLSENHTAKVGTQLYMSPEQIAGKSYGHKVDIYTMGLILFELMYPFSTQMERIKTMSDVKKFKFPNLFTQNSAVECTFVKQLLAEDAKERPSATDILNSPLLKDFQSRHKNKLVRVRTRTASSNSSETSLDNVVPN